MKSILLFLALFISVEDAPAWAGRDDLPAGTYLASTISPVLSIGATAVIRYDSRTFVVEDLRTARLTVHSVATILAPEGRHLGELVLPYDAFVEIENLDGRILDEQGEEIRSLEERDIKDGPATSGISLYDDNRVRVAVLFHNTYPYTIEYTYELRYAGYIGWPSWSPEDERGGVEYARFEVVLPEGEQLRWTGNGSAMPETSMVRGKKRYVWECRLLPAVVTEPLGPASIDQRPRVRIAPTKFEIEQTTGDFSSWKSFGVWYGMLQANRQKLPREAEEAVEVLTRDVVGRRSRIKTLYGYLQSTTRYVSIQLGIGGWQPFDAEYVWKRKYGDCKALVNFMRALLEINGIVSYPVLIKHGDRLRGFIDGFPSNQFNHVVLCVPDGADTIWLECTSPTIPFDHLGSGSEGRVGLMITPEGGLLVHTPESRASQNRQTRIARVDLNQSGDGIANISTVYSGDQQDDIRGALISATPNERNDWLRNLIDVPVFEVRDADFSGVTSGQLDIRVDVHLSLPRYATRAGKRLMFQPNLMERRTFVPEPVAVREQPVLLRYPYRDVDSVTFGIPGGFVVEALPKAVTLNSEFGHFHSSVTQVAPRELLFTRLLEISIADIAPGRYGEYRSFLEDVVRTDRAVAVLVDTRN
jgi:transglutaminase-like putative cysteine protease